MKIPISKDGKAGAGRVAEPWNGEDSDGEVNTLSGETTTVEVVEDLGQGIRSKSQQSNDNQTERKRPAESEFKKAGSRWLVSRSEAVGGGGTFHRYLLSLWYAKVNLKFRSGAHVREASPILRRTDDSIGVISDRIGERRALILYAAMANGFSRACTTDEERLERQFPVYDALYDFCKTSR